MTVMEALGHSESSALTIAAREARQAEVLAKGGSLPAVWRV